MWKKIKEYKKARVCGNIFQGTWNRFKTCLASVTGFPASRKCFTFRGNIMSNWNGLGLGENRFLVKKKQLLCSRQFFLFGWNNYVEKIVESRNIFASNNTTFQWDRSSTVSVIREIYHRRIWNWSLMWITCCWKCWWCMQIVIKWWVV